MIIKAAKLLISFILIFSPYTSFSQTLYGVWTDLDGSSVNPGISGENQKDKRYPRMAIDQKDQPHIIWQHGANAMDGFKGELMYRYWNKELGKWDTYGDADKEGGFTQSDDHVSGSESAIAIDSKGYPHVIYGGSDESIYYHYLYYRFWDGGKWTSYGGADQIIEPSVLTPNDIALDYLAAFYLDENDYPWIAVTVSTGVIFVFWDGEKWRGYGDSYTYEGIDTSPYSSLEGGSLVKQLTEFNGFPMILCVSKGAETYSYLLPTIIYWDGIVWQKYDTDELSFWARKLLFDSQFRIHALGNKGQGSIPGDPACYALYENGEWKTLGPNGIAIQYTRDINVSSYPDLAIDKNDNPHIVYSANSSIGEMRYTFWDGERWSGREWSQSIDGIHDSSGENSLYGYNQVIKLDSLNQPSIVYSRSNYQKLILYEYCNLSQKQSDLTVGLFFDKSNYESEDNLTLSIGLTNPSTGCDVNLFLALQNFRTNEYWFFPDWTSEIQSVPLRIPSDFNLPLTHILKFDIPCENPPLSYNVEDDWNNQYKFILAVFDRANINLLDMKSNSFLIWHPEHSDPMD